MIAEGFEERWYPELCRLPQRNPAMADSLELPCNLTVVPSAKAGIFVANLFQEGEKSGRVGPGQSPARFFGNLAPDL